MSEASEIYFRMCWMSLKSTASGKLRRCMDDIEISACGLNKPLMKPTERRPDESDPRKITAV